MAARDSLRGLVAQSMGARGGSDPEMAAFPAGNYTFAPVRGGIYKIIVQGPGGSTDSTNGPNGDGAGSGAYIEVQRALAPGQAVALSIGTSPLNGSSATSSVVTLPSGEVLTAGGGFGSNHAVMPRQGGIATVSNRMPADILLNGSAGGASATSGSAGLGSGGGAGGLPGGGCGGGGGAPGNLPIRGAAGGQGQSNITGIPHCGVGAGAGGSYYTVTFLLSPGGDGACLIVQQKL